MRIPPASVDAARNMSINAMKPCVRMARGERGKSPRLPLLVEQIGRARRRTPLAAFHRDTTTRDSRRCCNARRDPQFAASSIAGNYCCLSDRVINTSPEFGEVPSYVKRNVRAVGNNGFHAIPRSVTPVLVNLAPFHAGTR
jgi:hypothetical protein